MKLNFRQSWLNLMKMTEAHKPEVLTGLGVSLMIAAVPLAIAATIQTYKKVEDAKEELAKDIQEKNDDHNVPVDKDSIELPVKEVVKIGWKYYIPTIVATGVGAACSIMSTKEGLKRTAAMAAAYQLSEAAFNEYRNAAKEVVGEKKEADITQKVMKDRMELLTDEDGHVVNIYDTRDGTTLCFDYWSGRYFYSDIDYIRRQITNINQTMLKESLAFDGYATLNDVYIALGLPQTGSGQSLAWRVDKEGLIELHPSSILVDDRPCWVLNFTTPPHYVPSWAMDRM